MKIIQTIFGIVIVSFMFYILVEANKMLDEEKEMRYKERKRRNK